MLRACVDADVSVEEALAWGPAMLEVARDGDVRLAVGVVRGPAVVLGARQRAGRVLDLAACVAAGVPVWRRATTGTAAYIGERAIVSVLALPCVSAVVRDATLATLLNRNVRPFLKAFSGIAPAAYFGREWIAVERRAVAVLGYDATRDGRVLLEVIAGWSEGVALPAVVSAEVDIDRWRGRPTLGLVERARDGVSAEVVAQRVIDAVAAQMGAGVFQERPTRGGIAERVNDARSPVPSETSLGEPLPVPIGHVEAARGSGLAWLGGDVLAATWWLDEAARALSRGEELPDGAVMQGAREDDLVRAFAAAGRPATTS